MAKLHFLLKLKIKTRLVNWKRKFWNSCKIIKANTQYKVYKADTATRTETHIKRLEPSERVTEIAGMLSGKDITEAALKTAQELLNK